MVIERIMSNEKKDFVVYTVYWACTRGRTIAAEVTRVSTDAGGETSEKVPATIMHMYFFCAEHEKCRTARLILLQPLLWSSGWTNRCTLSCAIWPR